MYLKDIFIYPIKSMKGSPVTGATAEERGVKSGPEPLKLLRTFANEMERSSLI